MVVWTQGDTGALPAQFASIAPNAEVGTPFDLPMRRVAAGEVSRPLGDFETAVTCRSGKGYATALITRATFSKISPICASLTISGGDSAMVSAVLRIMMPSSWKPRSMAA